MAARINIRKATVADAAGIARVQVGSWRDSYRGIVADEWLDSLSVEQRTEVFRQRLGERGAEFYEMFVAESDGEIVGVCDVGEPRGRAPDCDCAAELYMIYVSYNQQRRGIGQQLFRRALELLVADGRDSMYLECLEQNPYRSFYEQLGGELCGAGGTVARVGLEYATIFYKWPDLARTLRTLAERAE